MTLLLYMAIGYLLVTSLILLINRLDFQPLLSVEGVSETRDTTRVSILIPARNEEKDIERCVRSALDQNYANFEVLVLDDESEDDTAGILERLSKQNPRRFQVIAGKPKPYYWLGKTWACHQLASKASGDVLVFIDADTWLEPDITRRVVRTMDHDVLDFLTIWPQQQLLTFWEKVLIPLVYYALLSMLPARYVEREPRWLPRFLRSRLSKHFAAACGQFMAFKKSSYQQLGGHAAVKDSVVEDVELARLVKDSGLKMKMFDGAAAVTCRMYSSKEEIYQGFRKNFLAGFNFNIPLFLLMGLIQGIVYILPFIILPLALFKGELSWAILSFIAIIMVLAHRIILADWFNWNKIYSLLHPIGVLWFQSLGLRSIFDYRNGHIAKWKGRSL